MEHDENSTVKPSITEIYSTTEIYDDVFDETTGMEGNFVDVATDNFSYDRSTDIYSATEEFEPAHNTVPSIRENNIMAAVEDTTDTEIDSTTESIITISREKEMKSYFKLKYLKTIFIDAAAKTTIHWKTSLMVLIILALVTLLLCYRRRIIQLQAEIVQKNLGNSYNQSCSYLHSTNTYTHTNFTRRQPTLSSKILSSWSYSDSDYEPTAWSRSNFYVQAYNSSLHLYESIDACNENIYAEISTRQQSIVSIENSNENSSTTSCKFTLT